MDPTNPNVIGGFLISARPIMVAGNTSGSLIYGRPYGASPYGRFSDIICLPFFEAATKFGAAAKFSKEKLEREKFLEENQRKK